VSWQNAAASTTLNAREPSDRPMPKVNVSGMTAPGAKRELPKERLTVAMSAA
jgi:hypothetical protein